VEKMLRRRLPSQAAQAIPFLQGHSSWQRTRDETSWSTANLLHRLSNLPSVPMAPLAPLPPFAFQEYW
jgi:hypothetical protein